jgi:hypothetical protein
MGDERRAQTDATATIAVRAYRRDSWVSNRPRSPLSRIGVCTVNIPTRGALATLILVGAIVVGAVPPLLAQSVSGWTLVTRYVSDSGSGNAAPTTVAIDIAGDKMRMEVSGPMMRGVSGVYLLIDGAAGTITNVMPAQKTAMTMDIPGVGGGVTGLVKASIKGDPTIDVEELGPGENILGLPTRRYHSRTAYTLVMTFGDQSCEKTIVTDGEQWMTPGTTPLAAAMKTLQSLSGGQVASAAMRALADATRAKMPGFALRSIATSTTTSASGESTSVKVSSDVTSFGAAEIDPARLATPAGFNVMDTRAMMKELDPSMVSAAITDAVRKSLCGGKSSK